jgi:hypothetical protein
MALISAHSEETSDAIYGGDEAAIYEASVQDIDLYRLCSVIFNDFVGITTSEPEARAGSASIKSPPPVSRPTASPALGMDVPTPPTVPKAKLPAEKKGSFREAASTAVAKHWQKESKSYPSGADTGPNHEYESYFQDETYHPPATGAFAGLTDDCVGLRLERAETGLSTTEARGVKRPSGGVLTSIGENESPVANSCEDLFDVLNAELGPMNSKKRPSRQNWPATRSPSPALHVSLLPSSPSSAPQPPAPHLPPHQYAARAPRASIAGPAADGAPLETVTDFAFQAEVIGLLTQANRKEGDSNTNSNSCCRSTPNTCHRKELAGHPANIKREREVCKNFGQCSRYSLCLSNIILCLSLFL